MKNSWIIKLIIWFYIAQAGFGVVIGVYVAFKHMGVM